MQRRARNRLGAAAGLVGVAIGVVACVDLFHTTRYDNLCDLNPSACAVDAATQDQAAPPEDAQQDSTQKPFNLCDVPGPSEAARTVCAWVGACAGPMGNQAFGTCFIDAIQAYDCNVRPGRPLLGEAAAFWACAYQAAMAKSCSDMRRCYMPEREQTCTNGGSTPYVACLNDRSSVGTRFVCPVGGGSPLYLERCQSTGRGCVLEADGARCAPSAAACDPTRCEGSLLHTCGPDNVNNGVDCKFFGAGRCNAAATACTPSDKAAACSGAGITCQGNVASACVAGRKETLDCGRLGLSCVPPADGGSDAGDATDISAACQDELNTPCGDDTCDGSEVVTCARGHQYRLDCSKQGLGGCRVLAIRGEPLNRAQCAPPP